MLLLVLIKLVLAEFSIEVMAFSNAIVGALLAAKTVLVLDATPLARSLERYRRIFAVAVKTSLYGVAGLLFGYLERLLDASHKVHGFGAAFDYILAHANHSRLLAWALGISIVFAHYFSFFEISQRMGEGALWRLFFEAPGIINKISSSSTRDS